MRNSISLATNLLQPLRNGFKKMIQKGTAILDVGGGNLQISLFDKDALVTTQSLKMGSVRIRQRLKELEKTNTNYAQLVEEFIRNDLTGFQASLSEGPGHKERDSDGRFPY